MNALLPSNSRTDIVKRDDNFILLKTAVVQTLSKVSRVISHVKNIWYWNIFTNEIFTSHTELKHFHI